MSLRKNITVVPSDSPEPNQAHELASLFNEDGSAYSPGTKVLYSSRWNANNNVGLLASLYGTTSLKFPKTGDPTPYGSYRSIFPYAAVTEEVANPTGIDGLVAYYNPDLITPNFDGDFSFLVSPTIPGVLSIKSNILLTQAGANVTNPTDYSIFSYGYNPDYEHDVQSTGVGEFWGWSVALNNELRVYLNPENYGDGFLGFVELGGTNTSATDIFITRASTTITFEPSPFDGLILA